MKFRKTSHILSFSSEGWIKISIGNNIYRYTIDAIFIDSIIRVHRKNKGKAIAMLKRDCRSWNKET